MVCFLKRPHMPSHPLSFFLLDLLSFERPDALPTICALAVKVSGRRPELSRSSGAKRNRLKHALSAKGHKQTVRHVTRQQAQE